MSSQAAASLLNRDHVHKHRPRNPLIRATRLQSLPGLACRATRELCGTAWNFRKSPTTQIRDSRTITGLAQSAIRQLIQPRAPLPATSLTTKNAIYSNETSMFFKMIIWNQGVTAHPSAPDIANERDGYVPASSCSLQDVYAVDARLRKLL